MSARCATCAHVKRTNASRTGTYEVPSRWVEPDGPNGDGWYTKSYSFDADYTELAWQCRRFPPHPYRGWPEMAHDDWCGEWKPAPSPAADATEGQT